MGRLAELQPQALQPGTLAQLPADGLQTFQRLLGHGKLICWEASCGGSSSFQSDQCSAGAGRLFLRLLKDPPCCPCRLGSREGLHVLLIWLGSSLVCSAAKERAGSQKIQPGGGSAWLRPSRGSQQRAPGPWEAPLPAQLGHPDPGYGGRERPAGWYGPDTALWPGTSLSTGPNQSEQSLELV